MKIEIIGDEPIKGALARNLEPKTDPDRIGTIVFAEAGKNRSQFMGLLSANLLAPTGAPVIITSVAPSHWLRNHPEFQIAMSYPNVVFVDAIGDTDRFVAALYRAERRERPDNVLVRDAYRLPAMRGKELQTIRHDLGHAQKAPEGSAYRAEMDARWMPLAKQMFGDLGREVLIAMVEEAGSTPTSHYAPLAGRSYRVVACDVEGTLVKSDGTLNKELHDELVQRADNEAIILWTGGDLEEIGKSLQLLGVSLPLISKHVARDVEIAEAIDDMPQDEAARQYGFKAKIYRQITA